MWRWTIKNLMSNPMEYIQTSLVVGAALLLVIFFDAVFVGEASKIIAYPQHANPDIWVMQRGVSNMHMATSYIWDWKQDRIAAMEGVDKVTPILYLNSIVEIGEHRWFSYIVGLQKDGYRAGPWKMASGKPIPGEGEAVIPAMLARMSGIKLGDHIRITDRTFIVVGLSEETFSMANSITFISYNDLRKIMSLTGSDSFLLVDLKPDFDTKVMVKRIMNEVDNINAVPSDEFIKNDRKLAIQMGVELIRIMTIIGSVLATFLVAFMLYVFTVHKQRELAIMKALGTSNMQIYSGLAFQAFCVASTGLVVALLLGLIAEPITRAIVPQISLLITGDTITRVAIVTLLVSIIASFLPARQILRVDPLIAFQQ